MWTSRIFWALLPLLGLPRLAGAKNGDEVLREVFNGFSPVTPVTIGKSLGNGVGNWAVTPGNAAGKVTSPGACVSLCQASYCDAPINRLSPVREAA